MGSLRCRLPGICKENQSGPALIIEVKIKENESRRFYPIPGRNGARLVTKPPAALHGCLRSDSERLFLSLTRPFSDAVPTLTPLRPGPLGLPRNVSMPYSLLFGIKLTLLLG